MKFHRHYEAALLLSAGKTIENRTFKDVLAGRRQNKLKLMPLYNSGDKSRHGLPVRTIHNIVSRNIRLFSPLRPRSVSLAKQ